MKYISTRGAASAVGFERVLLEGLAPDGGLYVPHTWPAFDREEIDAFEGITFAQAAAQVIAKFAGDAVPVETLIALAERAYATFDREEVAPVIPFGDEDWLMELYFGPTLAFKDVAMQYLGQLFAHVLEGTGERVTIIGATSGDTGAAAIEAFRGLDNVDVFILHPHKRVSEVQRRIMTSVIEPNIVNIAVEGDFDDCQAIVKELFADRPFAERLSLGGVNSINWVRLAVQVVYYFTTAAALGRLSEPTSFVVPTGNFGDIFAGYAAKRMGLPIDKLCVAVNDNDILHRALSSGVYRPLGVKQTTSPSMDIQVASNFERLVFEASGRDHEIVKDFIAGARSADGATIPAPVLNEIRRDFLSATVGEDEISRTIAEFQARHDLLIDPHTAVGVAAMTSLRASGVLTRPAVTLATAHPAKFPEAVTAASGRAPVLPARFADLYERREECLTAAASADAIKTILIEKARAA